MIEADLGHQRIRMVPEVPFPFRPDPGKFILHPDTEPEKISADMVFLTYMGKIEIPEAIALIKTDQQPFISHRDVARHGILLGGRFPALEGPSFILNQEPFLKKDLMTEDGGMEFFFGVQEFWYN